MLEIGIVGVRLKAEFMFQRHSERNDEVQRRYFGQQIRLPQPRILLVSLIGMDPDLPRQIPRCLAELSPVFAPIHIPLVGTRRAERNPKTDDETEHGEQ